MLSARYELDLEIKCRSISVFNSDIDYFHFSVQKYVYINGQLIALFIIFF